MGQSVVFRLLFALIVALAVTPGCTCAKASDGGADDASPGSAIDAPVPAPDGLLADVLIGAPNATWRKLQRGIGGPLGILSSNVGAVVCLLASLEPALGTEIDGNAPIAGAIADSPDDVAWAFAMKVTDPRRARDVLVDAERARYAMRAAEGMFILSAKGGGSMPVAAALANGGYFVIARNDADLVRLGPYAYRTAATKSVPPDGAIVVDAGKTALKGALRARLASLWSGARDDLGEKDDAARAAHGGRAPDYGDPRAMLALVDGAVQKRLTMLGDLDHARLVVDVLETSLRADLALTPSSADGPAGLALAAMHPGDATPLLDAPDSPLAVLFRDDEAGRASTGVDVEDALAKSLGDRIAPADKARLHDVVAAWTKARGEWTTLGLTGADGLFLRAPVTSADAADHVVKDALALVGTSPLKQALKIQDVTIGLGTATVTYGAAPGKNAVLKHANVAWGTKKGNIEVSVSTASPVASKPGPTTAASPTVDAGSRFEKSSDAPTLGNVPTVAAELSALDRTASFVAILQPLQLDTASASHPTEPAPAIVAWGKKGDHAYLRVETSDALARALVKMRFGF